MSKRKGRKYELEVKRLLEERGFTVIDVASNAGLTGTFDADLLVWLPGYEPKSGWQDRKDPAMVEMEVKYRKEGTGFTGLYDAHLETVGLGTVSVVTWRDCITGGIPALIFASDDWEMDQNGLTKFTADAFKPGVTVVACRASRKPWIFIWKNK